MEAGPSGQSGRLVAFEQQQGHLEFAEIRPRQRRPRTSPGGAHVASGGADDGEAGFAEDVHELGGTVADPVSSADSHGSTPLKTTDWMAFSGPGRNRGWQLPDQQ